MKFGVGLLDQGNPNVWCGIDSNSVGEQRLGSFAMEGQTVINYDIFPLALLGELEAVQASPSEF